MPATNITSAGIPRSVDRGKRERRYLITMGFRVLCFIGAYFAPSPWRWVLLIGAAILPGIAVVMANVVDERRIAQSTPESPQLGLAPAPEKPAPDDSTGEVLPGEVVREETGDQHALHSPPNRPDTESPKTQRPDTQRPNPQHSDTQRSGAQQPGKDFEEGSDGRQQSR